MESGFWHQLGFQGQTLAAELLSDGLGSGVILSPKDLSFENAVSRAIEYKDLDAKVALDLQLYNPGASFKHYESYPTPLLRSPEGELKRLAERSPERLTAEIVATLSELDADYVIAPALPYKPHNREIETTNRRLYEVAARAASELELPVWATVIIDEAVTDDSGLLDVLSRATQVSPGGWYLGFAQAAPIMHNPLDISRVCRATLLLALTGAPVFHAFAGPSAIITAAAGAASTGIGHFQNTWRFDPTRFEQNNEQGGGGQSTRKYFSEDLWGCIVQPDEAVQLASSGLWAEVRTSSDYATVVNRNPAANWSQKLARKHLISVIGEKFDELIDFDEVGERAEEAQAHLSEAMSLLHSVRAEGIFPRDMAVPYQGNWAAAIGAFATENSDQFEILDLL